MPLWNGLWVLLPNLRKVRFTMASLQKLWISAHLSASWVRRKAWFTFRRLSLNEIATVSEFYKEGNSIWVKCLGTDNRGKVKLSAKRVNQETGEDLEK